MKSSVLFVCLGNICRSPLAEAAFRREAERLGLDVEMDRRGTGDWHIGYPPDPRAAAVAARNGIDIAHLRARQVTADDFRRFDHIVALDANNLRDLERMRPAGRQGASCRCCSTMSRGAKAQAVADPYYGGDEHFDAAWADVAAGAEGAGAQDRRRRVSAFARRVAELTGVAENQLERLAGGDLSQVLLLRRPDGRCTVAKGGPAVATEAAMLRALAGVGVPTPMVEGEHDGVLLLEHVPNDGVFSPNAWADIGVAMRRLHARTGERYGWPVDYRIGTVALDNRQTGDWPASGASRG